MDQSEEDNLLVNQSRADRSETTTISDNATNMETDSSDRPQFEVSTDCPRSLFKEYTHSIKMDKLSWTNSKEFNSFGSALFLGLGCSHFSYWLDSCNMC